MRKRERPQDRSTLPKPLRFLTPEQVLRVDQALASIGPFGEVRLIKAKGRLRFIQQLESRELPQSIYAAEREEESEGERTGEPSGQS